MPEVGGQGALYVDPYNIKSIRQAVILIIENDMLREKLVNAGIENVVRYRVKEIADRCAGLYREVCTDINL